MRRSRLDDDPRCFRCGGDLVSAITYAGDDRLGCLSCDGLLACEGLLFWPKPAPTNGPPCPRCDGQMRLDGRCDCGYPATITTSYRRRRSEQERRRGRRTGRA